MVALGRGGGKKATAASARVRRSSGALGPRVVVGGGARLRMSTRTRTRFGGGGHEEVVAEVGHGGRLKTGHALPKRSRDNSLPM
jgi:hypothetical protein